MLGFRIAIAIGTIACSGAAVADSDWLARAGLEDATVLYRWTETGRPSIPGVTTGFHVQNADGTLSDHYFDQAGNKLSRGDLARRGIVPKNWTQRTTSVPASLTPGFPKRVSRRPPASLVKGNAPRIVLPPPSPAAVKADGNNSPGIQRIGVVQETPEEFSLEHGAWRQLADGRWAWTLALNMPDATGIRVYLNEFRMPFDAESWIIGQQGDAVPIGDGGWTPTAFGDSATLAVIVPDAAARDRAVLSIDETAYLYADWNALLKQSGNCNNDVACEPDWRTTAMGVGGMGTIGGADAIWCTGSLIADDDPETEVPWFLTADHCLGSQAEASTLEVYWLYEAEFCLDIKPPLASVPRTTGGATYITGSNVRTGTDVTLLRLRQQPPDGLVWLGWTTARPNVGDDTVCIHHPRGDVKKISFGSITDTGSPSAGGLPSQSRSRFHETVWSDGTTEPGSSGSPLMTNTGLIIGQLWGGRAACSLPNEPDYYGRIDQSFPILEPHLGQPPSDPFDIDKNGVVNAADLQLVVNAALSEPGKAAPDVDESGRVDAGDIELTLSVLLADD